MRSFCQQPSLCYIYFILLAASKYQSTIMSPPSAAASSPSKAASSNGKRTTRSVVKKAKKLADDLLKEEEYYKFEVEDWKKMYEEKKRKIEEDKDGERATDALLLRQGRDPAYVASRRHDMNMENQFQLNELKEISEACVEEYEEAKVKAKEAADAVEALLGGSLA